MKLTKNIESKSGAYIPIMKTSPYWPLQLSFKGSRNYLQGGDIHNSVDRLAGELTGMADAYVSKIAFRKFARQDCDLVREKPEDEAALVADGTITAGDNPPIQFWVIETCRPAIGRYDYDEQQIGRAHV